MSNVLRDGLLAWSRVVSDVEGERQVEDYGYVDGPLGLHNNSSSSGPSKKSIQLYFQFSLINM